MKGNKLLEIHEKTYEKINNPSYKKTLHQGIYSKIFTSEKEENIRRWFDDQNDSGISLSLNDIIDYSL